MDTYTGLQQLQANNNLSGLNEAASTCEFAHAVSSSMEKGKQDLLSKHVHFTGTGDKEIQLYRYLSTAHYDILAWWKSQKDINPRLSLLAKILLSIPAILSPHPYELFPQRD